MEGDALGKQQSPDQWRPQHGVQGLPLKDPVLTLIQQRKQAFGG